MITRIFAGIIVATLWQCSGGAEEPNRVHLKFDGSEAEAVLTILDKRTNGEAVTAADWGKLFTTTPYRRLKQRETSMRRSFTDEDFMKFVVTLDARREPLRQTLQMWQSQAPVQQLCIRSGRYAGHLSLSGPAGIARAVREHGGARGASHRTFQS
jgi:hypothetical protein